MAVFMFKQAFVNLYLQINDPPLTPYIMDFNCGWVGTGNGVWTYENPTDSYSDIYQVLAGHPYFLTLGDSVGTRFRVMFSTVDVSHATGKITGVAVNKIDYNNPAPHQNLCYTPSENGYLIIQKDNVGNSGIPTYLYDTSISHIFSYPLCRVEPDADSSCIMNIVQALLPCLQLSGQIVAVKKIEGYSFIVT